MECDNNEVWKIFRINLLGENMDTDVPRMPSIKNLHAILGAMQKAAVPEAFGIDFLKDMGFTSSNDRAVIKTLKYLGFLDAAGKPQASYKEYMNHTKSKKVLGDSIRTAYDDLFQSNEKANEKSATDLKGWFKTKTGAGDKVAEKMATTFKALASYADFSGLPSNEKSIDPVTPLPLEDKNQKPPVITGESSFGFTYRIEVHLPDTTNVDTFRAIFRAIREELMT